jgi:hypothetical protein
MAGVVGLGMQGMGRQVREGSRAPWVCSSARTSSSVLAFQNWSRKARLRRARRAWATPLATMMAQEAMDMPTSSTSRVWPTASLWAMKWPMPGAGGGVTTEAVVVSMAGSGERLRFGRTETGGLTQLEGQRGDGHRLDGLALDAVGLEAGGAHGVERGLVQAGWPLDWCSVTSRGRPFTSTTTRTRAVPVSPRRRAAAGYTSRGMVT